MNGTLWAVPAAPQAPHFRVDYEAMTDKRHCIGINRGSVLSYGMLDIRGRHARPQRADGREHNLDWDLEVEKVMVSLAHAKRTLVSRAERAVSA